MKKIFYVICAFVMTCTLTNCDYIKQYFDNEANDSIEVVVDSVAVDTIAADSVETVDSI